MEGHSYCQANKEGDEGIHTPPLSPPVHQSPASASYWLNRKPEHRKPGRFWPWRSRRERRREKIWGQTEMASKYPILQTFAAICQDVTINVLIYNYDVDDGSKVGLCPPWW